jgi:hypothetical protein
MYKLGKQQKIDEIVKKILTNGNHTTIFDMLRLHLIIIFGCVLLLQSAMTAIDILCGGQ